jgi:hypothetical protein
MGVKGRCGDGGPAVLLEETRVGFYTREFLAFEVERFHRMARCSAVIKDVSTEPQRARGTREWGGRTAETVMDGLNYSHCKDGEMLMRRGRPERVLRDLVCV